MNITKTQLEIAAQFLQKHDSGMLHFYGDRAAGYSAMGTRNVSFSYNAALALLRQAAGVTCCSKEFPHESRDGLQAGTLHWIMAQNYDRKSHSYIPQIEYAAVPSQYISTTGNLVDPYETEEETG